VQQQLHPHPHGTVTACSRTLSPTAASPPTATINRFHSMQPAGPRLSASVAAGIASTSPRYLQELLPAPSPAPVVMSNVRQVRDVPPGSVATTDPVATSGTVGSAGSCGYWNTAGGGVVDWDRCRAASSIDAGSVSGECQIVQSSCAGQQSRLQHYCV
jgi:hypothetical protein